MKAISRNKIVVRLSSKLVNYAARLEGCANKVSCQKVGEINFRKASLIKISNKFDKKIKIFKFDEKVSEIISLS